MSEKLQIQPRRRNLWVTDTLQWRPMARVAPPANAAQELRVIPRSLSPRDRHVVAVTAQR